MEAYNVLLVDDEIDNFANIERHFKDMPKVKIIRAYTKAEALEKIRDCFLHIACVDVALDRRTENTDGLSVLAHLKRERPSCKRFLITQFPEKVKRHWFTLLDPINPTIDGAVNKQPLDSDHNIAHAIRKSAERWIQNTVDVQNVQGIYERILTRTFKDLRPVEAQGKLFPGHKVKITTAEIDYVVSTLLGQGAPLGDVSSYDIESMEWEELGDGLSSSIVLRARPYTRSHRPGILCVVKLGPKADSIQEYLAYKRHVRFLVSHNRRVEMLAHFTADILGGVCYSWAGRSPEDRIYNIGHLFVADPPAAIKHLDTLFDPSTKEWYADIRRSEQGQGRFFDMNGQYRVDAELVSQHMQQFLHDIASDIPTARYDRENPGELVFEGGKLVLPRLGAPVVRQPYSECVIHGDLNERNILIGDDQVILIDFSYTGRGPASLDFASLQSSIRLSQDLLQRDIVQIVHDGTVDRQLWYAFWSNKVKPHVLPPWAELSWRLLELMRANFEKDVTEEEHAVTALLWAVRLYKAGDFRIVSETGKLRLLVWISMLQVRLDELLRKRNKPSAHSVAGQ